MTTDLVGNSDGRENNNHDIHRGPDVVIVEDSTPELDDEDVPDFNSGPADWSWE